MKDVKSKVNERDVFLGVWEIWNKIHQTETVQVRCEKFSHWKTKI